MTHNMAHDTEIEQIGGGGKRGRLKGFSRQ
jgi:hypothetical protein